MKSGRECPICAEGRPEEADGRLRVFEGQAIDADLSRDDAARGYVTAFFRGRHVVEPTELSGDESSAFWADLLRVMAAVESCYRPTKLNVLLLGNAVPHLHAHIVPRYADDPDAGQPPRFMMGWSGWKRLADNVYLAEVDALRAALADQAGVPR